MELFEKVYEAVNGEYADEADYFIQNVQVENEFAEGELCSEAYKRVYEANRRLCERSGVDEDPDVEIIIDSMFDITRRVAEKMFGYGAEYEKRALIKERKEKM